jgi:hypothetical protein
MSEKKKIKLFAESNPEMYHNIIDTNQWNLTSNERKGFVVHTVEAPKDSGLKDEYMITKDTVLNKVFKKNQDSDFKKDITKLISQGYDISMVVEVVNPAGEAESFLYKMDSADKVDTFIKASTNEFTLSAMRHVRSGEVYEKQLSKKEMEKYYSKKKR